MSRLNLTIADSDTAYLESMVKFLLSNHSKRFQVNSFSNSDYLEAFLEEPDKKTDILLVCPEFYSDAVAKSKVTSIIILTNGRIPENIHKHKTVNKYQHAEKLVSGILGVYAENSGDEVLIYSGEKNTRVIALYSPAGGAGKTTIAVNLARQCAVRGLPVFYLNLENIPSTGCYFETDDKHSFSDMLFYLKEKSKNLGLRIEALRSIDYTGVHYFSPQESLLELEEMLPEELLLMIDQFRLLNQYEIVIVDMPSGFNEQTASILKACDNILVVLNQDPVSITKLKRFEKEMDLYYSIHEISFSEKCILVLNKYSQKFINKKGYSPIDDLNISVRLPYVNELEDDFKDSEGSFNSAINQLINESIGSIR